MIKDKVNLTLLTGITIALCTIVFFLLAPVALAQSETTIYIVAKSTDDTVTTITFPEGQPGDTISDPYNDVDASDDSQVVATSNSEPVVRLKNTSGDDLIVWLSITDWTNDIVTAEDYELVTVNTTDVNVVDNVLSSDGNAADVKTNITIPGGEYRALYLEVVLRSAYGKSGSANLTILGEQ